jgi:hypothetical protein
VPSHEAETSDRARERARARPVPGASAGHDAHGDVAGLVGGTGTLLVQACALMPGLLPCLLLAGVLALPLVVPVVALGLVAAVVVGVPLGLWHLAKALVGLGRRVSQAIGASARASS